MRSMARIGGSGLVRAGFASRGDTMCVALSWGWRGFVRHSNVGVLC
jgi:hypothetical protein